MAYNEQTGVVLNAQNVTRFFKKGSVQALSGVSLSISAGQIHALLGPNGAGKTTFIKICSTLLSPNTGDVHIGDIDAIAHPYEARKKLGIALGGDLGFYPRASAHENLVFFADVLGVPRRQTAARVADSLEKVGLTADAERKVGTFSRGMVQRLHIARAILNKPRILLLDEPTNGLDPDISFSVRGLIRDVAAEGVGILLTSHQLAEVEELADTISIIQGGKITMRGDISQIRHLGGVSTVSVATLDPQDKALADKLLEVTKDVARVETRAHAGKWRVNIFWSTSPTEQMLADLAKHLGSYTSSLYTRPATLEEAYLSLLSEAS